MLWLSYLTSFLEYLCVYYISRKTLGITFIPEKFDILLFFCLTFVLGSIPDSYATTCWALGQLFILFYFFFKEASQALHGTLLSAFCCFFLLLTESLCAFPVFLFSRFVSEDYIGLCGNTLTLCLCIILLSFPLVPNVYKKIASASMPLQFLFLNSYLFLTSISLIFKQDISLLYEKPYISILAGCFILTFNVCILFYDQKTKMQAQELVNYSKNFAVYQSLIDDIRSRQHSYANRMQTLSHILHTCENYEELSLALQQYTSKETISLHAYPLLQINMPLLAASLYAISSEAEKNKIDVHFDVVSSKLESHCSELLLSDLATTFLQNAVEASTTGQHIYVHLSSEEGKTRLEVRNQVSRRYSINEITTFFQKNFSTKSAAQKQDRIPHGLGLYQLRKDVLKHNGELFADCIPYNDTFWMCFSFEV